MTDDAPAPPAPQGEELRALMHLDPPAITVLKADGSLAWSVGYDGTVIIGNDGFDLDAASRAFWQGVARDAPGLTRWSRWRVRRRIGRRRA